jgi:hypothetical protein
MKLSKHLDPKTVKILKIVGLSVVGLVVVIFIIELAGSSLGLNGYQSALREAPASLANHNSSGAGTDFGLAPDMPTENAKSATAANAALEVTEYSAVIETRHFNDDCAKVSALKARSDVIFERSDKSQEVCNYSFKVKRENAGDVLAIIKALDPKQLNESIYTIKSLIDSYSQQLAILENRKTAIEQTLENSVQEYNDITALAAKTKDAASLATIIDSKINIVEKLTQERLDINDQLAQLDKDKADQLDRLNYTNFSVNISETKLIDWRELKDSWTSVVQDVAYEINNVFEGLTVGLLVALFYALEIVIYIFLILIAVKYLWRAAKYIWKK